MQENFSKFKGFFKIECYNKDDQLIDSYEDNNFIMKPARRTVAEMFSGKKNTGLNYLVLGTSGGTTTPYIPIIEENGFNKDRQRIYSEPLQASAGQTVFLYKYETVSIVGKGTYRYIGETGDVELSQANLDNLFEIKTDNYTYYFRISPSDRVKNPDGVTNYALSENNSCTIGIDANESNLDATTVTFIFELGMSEGNNQHKASDTGFGSACSLFNEAGMYFNDRLFCSKCFIPKVKDDSTRIKLTWKIIF